MPKPISIGKLVLLLLCIAGARPANGQHAAGLVDGKTLLQLNAASIQVVSYGRLSLDSTMKLAIVYRGMSPIPVITEGIDDAFSKRYSGWMNGGHVDSLLSLLPGFDAAGQAEARLLLGAWYAFQPGPSNYRKAIVFLRQAREASISLGRTDWEAQSYCLLSKAYYMLADTVNGNRWYFSLLRDPAFSGMEWVLAKAGGYAGMYYPFLPQTHRFRLDCLSGALQRFERLKDTGNQINILMDVAYMNFAAGNVEASKAAVARSLHLQHAWNFPNTQYAEDLLAYLDLFGGDYASALSFALSALNSATATADRHFLPIIEERIGQCFMRLNKKEAAFQWYQKSLQAEIALGGDMALYATLGGLGNLSADVPGGREMLNTIRNTLNKYPPTNVIDLANAYQAMAECYRALKMYTVAQHYYQLAWQLQPQVIKIRGGMKNAILIHRMGAINMLNGHYRDARQFLSMLISKPYSTDVSQATVLDVYNDLYTVDSILGNYRSALHYLANYEYLLKKIDSEKQDDQLLALNVKYETLQREKRLQELQTENNLQTQKEATDRKLFYGGFALLGFIIIMVYARYYSNKRKNRQLNAQKQEIDQQNMELQELNHEQTLLLEEKEWLLREIHHRVKNNLQVITSLLLSQSEFLRDQAAIDIMKESQRRVQTMSLIHQKLYHSGNLSTIYMPEYIGELVDYLQDSFVLRQKVSFTLDIEKIGLDVSKAVPLGLILNEVITNAFKYAFPHSSEDRIWIRLLRIGDLISLEVKDNGRGLPKDFDFTTGSSFGMILMRGMAEDLQGIFEVNGTDGTSISIRFNGQASARK